jgi:hypothetical protein
MYTKDLFLGSILVAYKVLGLIGTLDIRREFFSQNAIVMDDWHTLATHGNRKSAPGHDDRPVFWKPTKTG